MNNKETVKELKSIYDCLNVKNIEERATLFETYSRLMQVANENTELKFLIFGCIVTSEQVRSILKAKARNIKDVSQYLLEVRETTMMINPKIELHYIDEDGFVKDLREEVLDFIIELISKLEEKREGQAE